ncbi:hypothetical protein G7Z17_g7232 [Cylindrodendrum hubeiense]|uniref:Ketoreductase domain-containing protein n=1 Tax=Cylindrodendrum hubeiense TaxID=595255 RepID=A0A9P5LEE0_9HYPO|nr:hypothetical protein G7Z17_g7232 [Cylindrodendrum hubeiense]
MAGNNGLVLLTGATGHVGFAVLLKALESGYNVRVVLRDMSKADSIRCSDPVQKALSSVDAAMLSFVLVADITSPGAFDSVMKDVTYVVHVASPIDRGKFKDLQAELIEPAMKGTMNVLNSARAVPSVRRVVITSSTSAIAHHLSPPAPGACVAPSDRLSDRRPDTATRGGDEAYSAGKVAALNATDLFLLAANDLHFDVINIMPSYVFGPKGLATSPKDVINGSNVFGIGLALLKESWTSVRIDAASCHVDDVAEVHIRALGYEESGPLPLRPGTHRDFTLAVPFRPEEVREIIMKAFPSQLWEDEGAVFGAKGVYEWYHVDYDVTATEALLGRKLKSFEEQIASSGAQVFQIAGSL